MSIEAKKERIAELESWLKSNPNQNIVATVHTDLRRLKEELTELEYERPIERDTFDLRNHNFNERL